MGVRALQGGAAVPGEASFGVVAVEDGQIRGRDAQQPSVGYSLHGGVQEGRGRAGCVQVNDVIRVIAEPSGPPRSACVHVAVGVLARGLNPPLRHATARGALPDARRAALVGAVGDEEPDALRALGELLGVPDGLDARGREGLEDLEAQRPELPRRPPSLLSSLLALLAPLLQVCRAEGPEGGEHQQGEVAAEDLRRAGERIVLLPALLASLGHGGCGSGAEPPRGGRACCSRPCSRDPEPKCLP
mmetsp:Transcript_45870/g.132847  ORF Transcript_45870/g.132847 Transcript_45870/m.132847 type:complete len:245 (-) Transcript_45870:3-737(-)